MSASLLTTIAILKANWDSDRDYLANIEPFVANCLKKWPVGDEVKPEELRRALAAEFSLPPLPINVAQELRERSLRAGLTRRTQADGYRVVPRQLDEIPDLLEARTDALAHLNALSDALMAYAREVHELEWSEEAAEQSLERFVEEFSVELARARRKGGITIEGVASEQLTVVSGFARSALERDPATFGFLEEMVRGSMLANVLYFQALGTWSPDLRGLVVYLDTTLLLRMLGLAPQALADAAQELHSLLTEFKVSMRVFDHTVIEMLGVLDGVAAGLRGAREGRVDLGKLRLVNREIVDEFLARNFEPSDVLEITADLERRLLRMGVQPVETPPYPARPDFDEARLEDTLQRVVRYRSSAPREKDVKSLAAVRILRGGRKFTELGRTPALFVTSNTALATAAGRSFGDDTPGAGIGHCHTDISLTVQLWVRKPAERPNTPKKLLMAESVAALNPAPALWDKYLTAIERQRGIGVLDDQQVKSLVYSMGARERFFEVTHGEPDAVDDATPLAVLARHEEAIRKPAEEERDELAARVSGLEKEKSELEDRAVIAEQKAAEAEAAKRTTAKRFRWVIALALGTVAALVVAALLFTGLVSDPWPRALVVFGGLVLASVAAALVVGVHRTWIAIVGFGVLLSLFVGLHELFADNRAP